MGPESLLRPQRPQPEDPKTDLEGEAASFFPTTPSASPRQGTWLTTLAPDRVLGSCSTAGAIFHWPSATTLQHLDGRAVPALLSPFLNWVAYTAFS